jgi:hypothetical protein
LGSRERYAVAEAPPQDQRLAGEFVVTFYLLLVATLATLWLLWKLMERIADLLARLLERRWR